MVCDVKCVLTHQRVCVLQVVVTVVRRCGCLTGFCSYFQLFEPCKTVARWKALLHQSDEGVKWGVAVRFFSFLEETSGRDGFSWTASASVDSANDLNHMSAPCLDVEELRGEGMSPLARSVAQMCHGLRKFWICTFLVGNCWCRSVTVFLQCNDTLWNAFVQRKQIFLKKLQFFEFFGVFLWLERECSVSPT